MQRLEDLRDVKVCSPSVSSLAGWVLPMSVFIKEGIMPVLDCNNHVKTAMGFFGDGCVPDSLSDKFNPLGK